VSGLDWFPTLLAAAGDTNIADRLLKGWQTQAGGLTYKVHLAGLNIVPYLEEKEAKSPRKSFFHFNDDGQLVAIRYENWKQVFCEQRAEGTLRIWAEPFTCPSWPEAGPKVAEELERVPYRGVRRLLGLGRPAGYAQAPAERVSVRLCYF